MVRRPNHHCPTSVDPAVEQELINLHQRQAGRGRHLCVICTYVAGMSAGTAAAKRDRRRSAWQRTGGFELCSEGHAAPTTELARVRAAGRGEAQATHRWGCAACAWSMGWRDGVASVPRRSR
jgi:hypothetical protein